MNILIIGTGAREQAILKALHRSPQKPSLFCYGAYLNPGIQQYTTAYELGSLDAVDSIVQIAKRLTIQLAIIGPEAPLEKGLSDAFWLADIPCIGPRKKLAQIETSKAFTRTLMDKYHIPGLPRYASFDTLDEKLIHFLEELGEGNYVIKADGLMGGKGVKIAGEHLGSFNEAIRFCEEIFLQKQSLVIEEKLEGQEFSFMCFADGKHLIPMPLVQDHKRAYEGDRGPNTGGMGSYSCADLSLPFLTEEEVAAAFAINQAVFHALQQECEAPYMGILYGSFMATKKGIYVIEFNARFGDPEAMNVLALLETDFCAVCQAMVQGELSEDLVKFANKATVCKYLVPEGYPDHPLKDFQIEMTTVGTVGVDTADTVDGSLPKELYLASVRQSNSMLFGTGGRVAASLGIADTLAAAEQQAEAGLKAIKAQAFHRPDIGTESLIQSRIDAMRRIREA
jgi:phosphoribosylamine--glycine ligase